MIKLIHVHLVLCVIAKLMAESKDAVEPLVYEMDDRYIFKALREFSEFVSIF